LVLYHRFRISQQQKQIIEKQKELVEHNQNEIISSITYAKRLQQAILPPALEIKKYLPEGFLIYKPKDIVAGDFYWMEQADGHLFVAVADCTGHGVPGALVSIVCSNSLNRAIKEFGLRETGLILDKTRELVLETFSKSNSEVMDGMDISLLSINTLNQKITWSGANSPLWYIVDGPQGKALVEIKADKQPIGKMDNPFPFTCHAIPPGKHSFYLFTDGYADQFGGPRSKKFKRTALQDLFLQNAGKPMVDQKAALEKAFDEWKGNLAQIDDFCILGFQVDIQG
jgi:serine phosphatase RsbU (regulator of sigma subunit)